MSADIRFFPVYFVEPHSDNPMKMLIEPVMSVNLHNILRVILTLSLVFQGIYSSDSFAKSMNYCYNTSSDSEVKLALLCEVCWKFLVTFQYPSKAWAIPLLKPCNHL